MTSFQKGIGILMQIFSIFPFWIATRFTNINNVYTSLFGIDVKLARTISDALSNVSLLGMITAIGIGIIFLALGIFVYNSAKNIELKVNQTVFFAEQLDLLEDYIRTRKG